MILQEIAPGKQHSILSTDIDDRMLARAQAGVFQEAEVRNVTKQRLSTYFTPVPGGYEAQRVLKSILHFHKHDLLKDSFRPKLDLILCRNVVIYFTDETKSALYRRFYQALRPGGYLFVGGTERITDYQDRIQSKYPFFYRKPEK